MNSPWAWINHDALFIFSDLLGKPKRNLISQILFFCITCFSHLALITCSVRLEQFWNGFHPHPSPESESQFKTENTRKWKHKGPTDNQSPPQYLEKNRRPSGAKSLASVALSSSSLRNSPPPQNNCFRFLTLEQHITFYHLSILTAFWKESMINWLSNLINCNR